MGNPPYSVGNKVQLYYRSRQKPSCNTCISKCSFEKSNLFKITLPCSAHTNLFGESTITEILHFWDAPYKENGNETWFGFPLGHAERSVRESWAIADGFSSYAEADNFFKKSTNDVQWDNKNLDVIIWGAEPIVRRWQPTE